jgi:glycosyltransferase involved in cell wall biosynthesis
MTKPLFSAAMIVRDEEEMLGDCLASIKGIVDEIIIVDTGSVDATRDIALAYGAILLEAPWEGDFSKARNAALDAASGQWILYIDADERLGQIDRATVERLLSDQTKSAYRVRFHPQTGFTRSYEYRVFRNDPRVRFERRMHEKIIPGIERMSSEDKLHVGKCEITIHHIGYDGDQSHKHARNLPLLKEQSVTTPEDVYNLRHLGVILEAQGDDEAAIEAWTRGIEIARRNNRNSEVDALPFGELLRWQHNHEVPDEALMHEARQRFPNCPLIKWIDARFYMQRGDFLGACTLLEALAAIDSENFTGEQTSYDRRIFDVFAYESLGYCHFKLGDFSQSAKWFADALREEPDRIDLKARLAVCESKAGSGFIAADDAG